MAEDTLDLKGKPWRHVLVVSLCTVAVCVVACTLLTFVLWFNQAGAFADTPASMPVFTGLLCGGFVGVVFMWVFYTDQPAPSKTGSQTEIETVMGAPASTPAAKPAVRPVRRGRHRWVSVKAPGDELDQDLWAQMDREARRRLRHQLRKRRTRQLALRIAMAPFAAVGFAIAAVLAAQQWMDVLPDALVLTLAPVLGVIGAGYFTFSRIRSTVRMWRGDVYVVTGRVQGTESGETVGEEAAATIATNYVTAELSHENIHILLTDGGLAEPETDLTRGDLSARFSREALGSGVDRPPTYWCVAHAAWAPGSPTATPPCCCASVMAERSRWSVISSSPGCSDATIARHANVRDVRPNAHRHHPNSQAGSQRRDLHPDAIEPATGPPAAATMAQGCLSSSLERERLTARPRPTRRVDRCHPRPGRLPTPQGRESESVGR